MEYRWNKIHNKNRQMFYKINENKHEQKFIQDMDIRNNINIIFQSDCDVINHHLNEQYDFDIVWNKYKYYLPNSMKHFGKVDKDQDPHSDYPFTEKAFKKKTFTKKHWQKKKEIKLS